MVKYLAATSSDLDHLGGGPDIGVMVGPRTGGLGSVRTGRPWASDCDALSRHGYSEEAYLTHLERIVAYRSTCLFIVVPDVPGDGEATLSCFECSGDLFAQMGYPLAYCLQDGCEDFDLPLGADVAFLGGTDPWRKAWGAKMLGRARTEGLRTHVGRVNSKRRMQALRFTAADTVDGTYISFVGVERGVKDVNGWLAAANAPALFSPEDFEAPANSPLYPGGLPGDFDTSPAALAS